MAGLRTEESGARCRGLSFDLTLDLLFLLNPPASRSPISFFRHRAYPFDAGAAQQLQKHRFRLIVEIVRQRDKLGRHRRQCRVTGSSRRGFEAGAGRHIDFDDS